MRTASSSTTYVSRPTPQLPLSLMRAGLVMTGGVLVFFFLLSLLPAVQAFIYSGRIYPGVSVGGVDLSGLSQEEAAVLLTQRLDYPQRGRIVFQEGTQVWSATPGELGLFVDVQNSALAAYTVGRGGGLLERLSARFQAWYSGADIPPLFVFDERIAQHYLEGIASQIDKPVVEASLSVNGVEVVVHPGQVGRTLDLRAALDSLQTQVQTMTDGILPLVVQETPPVILDASAQAEFARLILSAPLTIRSPESSPGR